MTRTPLLAGAALAAALGVVALAGCATDAAPTKAAAAAPEKAPGEIVGMRRLTASQYRQSIADIFGPGVKIQGRFEPEVRREGLIAVGSAEATISASGMEQYYAMAGSIAHQVTSEPMRARVVTCQPANPAGRDDACARTVLAKYGRQLFRRPLTGPELTKLVALAGSVADQSKDFHAGLEEALSSLLTSPNFLFRIERAAAPAENGVAQLDGYSRASRLSYLFWNTTPDEALLKAAESGELMTKAGIDAQVERLSASPRLAEGVGAFFDDMLQLGLFDNQSKDPQFFPKYSQVLASEAREQTVRTVVDLLVKNNGDYRDIFTTRDTFMTRTLAMVYKVPYTSRADWARYTFDENSGRSGLLTQISFLSLFSHPATSSPTKRGVALNEIFLCEVTPAPPGNVDFSAVNGSGGNRKKTVRLRLEAHATDETCASCHSMVDPAGLALERFDSLGEYREREGGEIIDVKAEWDGHKFEGATGLGQMLRENPRAPACVVRNLYATGVGRAVTRADRPLMTELNKTFAAGGYRIPAFLKALAANETLYTATVAAKPAAPVKVATLQPKSQDAR